MNNDLFVCIFGIAVVFIGLTCIVGLCKLMSLALKKTAATDNNIAVPNVSTESAADVIPNREEMVAAVSAVIAEELGNDISAIRIVSLKKL